MMMMMMIVTPKGTNRDLRQSPHCAMTAISSSYAKLDRAQSLYERTAHPLSLIELKL